jgi:hypothetical protein
LEKIKAANQETIDFMTAQLEAYFDSVPHKVTKTQESYQLPGAKLVRKQQAPEFVKDDAALVSYLKKAAPECVETIEKPRWGEYKKRCGLLDGAVVDMDVLLAAKIVRKPMDGLKVLGNGELNKKLTVKAAVFSATAKAKIEAAGGQVEEG